MCDFPLPPALRPARVSWSPVVKAFQTLCHSSFPCVMQPEPHRQVGCQLIMLVCLVLSQV